MDCVFGVLANRMQSEVKVQMKWNEMKMTSGVVMEVEYNRQCLLMSANSILV